MADPRTPDPRHQGDPLSPDAPHAVPNAPYRDPAADPRIANQTIIQPSSGRGGIIIAGIVAALLVVAVIAFTSGPATDPGTTAVIPETTESAPVDDAAPATEAAPSEPAAPVEEPAAPADDAPAAPADEAPAANQ
ncbi:hypothetical protein [Mesorhizobium sp. CAU 1741]|uniref:hypothetical protein n=1 Tax=Mesorhizobium sp. CAU 1741 TaxID=3140366 RepID=UPI00325A7F96